MSAKPQSLMVAVILAGIATGDVPTAEAQGFLQRLGDRIRSRVGSPYFPPVPNTDPNGPNGIGNRNSSRYDPYPNTPPSQQPPSAQRPNTRVPPNISGDTNTGEPTLLNPEPTSPGQGSNRDPGTMAESRSKDDLGGSILAPRDNPRDSAEANRQRSNRVNDASTTVGRATIGIRVMDPRPETPVVRVVSFNEESRADEAGMRRGDAILSIDGVPTPNIAAIAAELSTRSPGEVVQVQVGRLNQIKQLPVKLVAKVPFASTSKTSRRDESGTATEAIADAADMATISSQEPIPPSAEARPVLGIDVEEPTGSRGALVVSVAPDSLANRFGIEVGDRIVAVDDRFVVDTIRLAESLDRRRDPTAPMKVKLVRDEELVDLVVLFDGSTPPKAPNASALSSAETTSTGGSILGELGSTLGGLFAAKQPKTDKSKLDSSAASSDEPLAELPSLFSADGDLPSPMPMKEVDPPLELDPFSADSETLSADVGDTLDFSDDEPMNDVIFEEAAALPSANAPAGERIQSKKPSLAKQKARPGKKDPTASSNDEVLRELRAEIERLQNRLETLEKTAKD